VRELCRDGLANGWRHFKLKVGRDLREDVRRAALVREVIGDEGVLMLDANQVWDVDEAIDWMGELAAFKPLWIEEPTNPDDVLGHARIARAMEPFGIGVATGEHCHNRVMFKQYFQAEAIRFAQIDPCRLGGINEALAVQLMAAKFGVAVCPHAGGVGLCEYVQHLSIFDYLGVSTTTEGRVTEYVDHLHEHFVDPAVVKNGHYSAPVAPGTNITMLPSTLEAYSYPFGHEWTAALVEGV
jgi:L-fuconate dehydratase